MTNRIRAKQIGTAIALLAAAVGLALGVPLDDIFGSYEPPAERPAPDVVQCAPDAGAVEVVP